MESEKVLISDEQLEILNTGRAFAALEASAPYKKILQWIEGFERQAAMDARSVLQSGAANDTYIRASIRKDTACELREMIQDAITAIKAQATDVANELKENQ